MKHLFIILLSIITFATSCKKEDPEPNQNEKFIGTYVVSETYSTSSCGSGTDNYNITISAGANGNEVIIDNFANGLNGIRGNVDGIGIIIPAQPNQVASSLVWDVVTGHAVLNGNKLEMDYEMSDALHLNNCGTILADLTATK